MRVFKLDNLVRKTAVVLVLLMSFSAASVVIAPVQADPPEQEVVEVTSFTASWLFNDVWAFSGTITGGPTRGGLDVIFSGILKGESTVTSSIGSFYKAVDLAGQKGTAMVIVHSADSIPSGKERTEAGN